jgi:hypothetical protein
MVGTSRRRIFIHVISRLFCLVGLRDRGTTDTSRSADYGRCLSDVRLLVLYVIGTMRIYPTPQISRKDIACHLPPNHPELRVVRGPTFDQPRLTVHQTDYVNIILVRHCEP